jgi:hypothetical protein
MDKLDLTYEQIISQLDCIYLRTKLNKKDYYRAKLLWKEGYNKSLIDLDNNFRLKARS